MNNVSTMVTHDTFAIVSNTVIWVLTLTQQCVLAFPSLADFARVNPDVIVPIPPLMQMHTSKTMHELMNDRSERNYKRNLKYHMSLLIINPIPAIVPIMSPFCQFHFHFSITSIFTWNWSSNSAAASSILSRISYIYVGFRTYFSVKQKCTCQKMVYQIINIAVYLLNFRTSTHIIIEFGNFLTNSVLEVFRIVAIKPEP